MWDRVAVKEILYFTKHILIYKLKDFSYNLEENKLLDTYFAFKNALGQGNLYGSVV